ncbi:sigma-70 family RNA polymerase sigma factor [Mesorhizobium sp.]|uniref:RNA polymerase sigma factor n=1 Tax=Mesorhizobium sp. TaxID=1871066 RepID=UPI0012161716|nr:sigma-70 family RNA polymerase sigma factor [Mesorhizobium sp.]TIN83122.1 MAG: sigma-70 family RNA polymerase sigma factor [Mesorhizobium sp.]
MTRPAAFDAKVQSYMPGLRRYAFSLGRDGEDILQDGLVAIFDRWNGFIKSDGPDPWHGFYTWMRWQVRSVYANKSRIRSLIVDHPNADSIAPAAQEYAAELSIALSKIERMPEEVRTSLMLAAIGEDTDKILDAAGNICVSALWQRVSRARRELRGEKRRRAWYPRKRSKAAA